MEWLLAHTEDQSLDEPFTEEEALEMKSNLEAPLEPAKKPLTEEEKAEKLAKLEELRCVKMFSESCFQLTVACYRKVKKAEREEKEKQEAKNKELKRITSGKEMSDIRASIQEQEIKKMAELRRREKQEEKEAKAKVLAQIEADKAARRAEREAAKVRES